MDSQVPGSGKIIGKLPKNKISIIIVAAGIIGIVLIFLSDIIHVSPSSKQNTSSQDSSGNYETKISKRLESIIGQINGVGRVQVMVTIESGVENIYEKDKKESSQSQGGANSQTQVSIESSHVILNGSSGNQQALLTKQIQPVIQGVVVVCDGGADPDVQEAVTDTVSTALGIATNHISISRMKPADSQNSGKT